MPIEELAAEGRHWLHVSGYFVLLGLLDNELALYLFKAQDLGMRTSLDVVTSPAMQDPSFLWSCLPYLDYFMCNEYEGHRITGEENNKAAAKALLSRGSGVVLMKLVPKGCLVASKTENYIVAAEEVSVIDTTGAGDAFAAGFIAAILKDDDLQQAVLCGNNAGGQISQQLGAVTAWINEK